MGFNTLLVNTSKDLLEINALLAQILQPTYERRSRIVVVENKRLNAG